MALTDGLVSYWPLNESGGNAIDVHGVNQLTEANGPIASGTPLIAPARDFEADLGQYFTHADNVSLSTGDIDFTVTAWVNMETVGGFPCVMNKGIGASPDADQEWSLYYHSGVPGFVLEVTSASTTASVGIVGAPSPSTWVFLTAWHDSVNDVIGLAVNNGAPSTTSTSAGVNNGTRAFELGGATARSTYLDGLIAEVGFWKRVLSSQERTAIYNGGAGLSYASINPRRSALLLLLT